MKEKIDWTAEAKRRLDTYLVESEIDPGAVDWSFEPIPISDVLALLETASRDAYERGLKVHENCVDVVIGSEAELRDGTKLIGIASEIEILELGGAEISPDVALIREPPHGYVSPRKR